MDVVRTEAESELITLSEKARLNGPAWFEDLQAKARADFSELGLPSRRVEAFKYTDLKTLFKTAFPPATGSDKFDQVLLETALGQDLAGLDAYRLVLVNGQFDERLSDNIALDGVDVFSLSDALSNPPSWFEGMGQLEAGERDAVQALNLALVQGGLVVRVEEKVQLDKPLHVVFVSQGEAAQSFASRLYIDVGAGAEVSLVESHVNSGATGMQSNVVTEWRVGSWARVRHYKQTRFGDEVLHLANVIGQLGQETDFKFFQLTVDGGVSRNQIYLTFEGDDAKADVSGVALLDKQTHADMTLVMAHKGTGCESRELFKTVLNGEARAVFQGKVIVEPGAQQTDGEMMSNALLLSETAEFDSKPELEIYADDVVCGHGATSGQIDEELLFYLKARGLPEQAARELLIQAFVGEAFELVEIEALREQFAARASEWYAG